ncbi:phosphotransferase family protein [Streptomyces sp. NPDC008001]|uniref:phosphotransferase family protein n=1 Tax=Streptomyces sp. NPDC008001 TaxID=3364804 RepID=UPI0036EF90B0
MTRPTDLLGSLAERWKLDDLTPVGSGLEFSVYSARDRDGRDVALRLAHRRFDSNANDPQVDTRALLVQEYEITRHLAAHGFPVAEPLELHLADDPASPDVLLSLYVPDDASRVDGFGLGELLARLHRLPPPRRLVPVASEGLTTRQVLATRIRRRWVETGRYVADWPAPPDPALLARHLSGITESALVHLDVRSANIRRRESRVEALLDWSNALLGDGTLEFGRLTEYARYPENQLDPEALRAGYTTLREAPPAATDPAVLACRLDTALMLALVFLSEAPDPARGPSAADHARELADALTKQG